MNKTQRILIDTGNTTGSNYLQIRLEQDVDTLEVMSLKLDTKDAYQEFNADYGVLVGRVTANGSLGTPNAKISVFIPLSDDDQYNSDIVSVYPYTKPSDMNNNGKRYNLLPRVGKVDPETGQVSPKQPFGSFPIKEEIVTNETQLEVYKKYYKYTTVTNDAGDYMIFGVPTGTQTIHMSVDITDAGKYSMTPAAMVTNLGYSANLFTDNETKIKPSVDLDDLPNIETQEISVDIIPFWGDTENFEIGITQQDFRIRSTFAPTFYLFGSAFTDSSDTMRGTGDDDDPNEKEIRDFYMVFPNAWSDTVRSSSYGTAIANKRIGNITEKIYYYPPSVNDADIDNGIADPTEDMLVLDRSQYSIYSRNGDFVFIVNCNRDKITTNEAGHVVSVPYDHPDGVYTTFRGFVTLEFESDELPMTSSSSLEDNQDKARTEPLRLRYKFPQHAKPTESFDYNDGTTTEAWRKQHMKFEAQKFYSFSRFHATIANNRKNDNSDPDADDGQFWNDGSITDDLFFKGDEVNVATNNVRWNIGPIIVGDYRDYPNTQYDMQPNADVTGAAPRFGANWLNFSIYFPQMGYTIGTRREVKDVRTASYLHPQWKEQGERNSTFIIDNNMKIAGGQINTKWFPRSDLHWTDIIEVPIADIVTFQNSTDKGFKLANLNSLEGDQYRNGEYEPPYTTYKGTWDSACPLRGGLTNGDSRKALTDTDPYFYFYKGFAEANCIQYLFELGLVT